MVAAEDDICTIMTVESGKPFKESKAEFTGGYVSWCHCSRSGQCSICSSSLRTRRLPVLGSAKHMPSSASM